MYTTSPWRFCALVATICIILAISCAAEDADIYLSPQGATAWDGSCPSAACASNSPCSVPSSLVSINAPSKHCSIAFGSGSYSGTLQLQQSSPNTTIAIVLRSTNYSALSLSASIAAEDVSLSGFLSGSYVSFSKKANSQTHTLTVTSSAVSAPSSGALCQGPASMYSYGFTCINGEWHRSGDWVISRQVRFLSESSKIFVEGNVSFAPGGSIYFVGMESGFTISGCITSKPDTIYLDYSDGWPSRRSGWYQTVIAQQSQCTITGDYIPFTLLNPKDCDKARTRPTPNLPNGLEIHFVIDGSKCRAELVGMALGIVFGVGALLAGVLIWSCWYSRRDDAPPVRPSVSTALTPKPDSDSESEISLSYS